MASMSLRTLNLPGPVLSAYDIHSWNPLDHQVGWVHCFVF